MFYPGYGSSIIENSPFPRCVLHDCFKTSPGTKPFFENEFDLHLNWTCEYLYMEVFALELVSTSHKFKCENFHMKIRFDFIWKISHLDSFWNRGKGNSEMTYSGSDIQLTSWRLGCRFLGRWFGSLRHCWFLRRWFGSWRHCWLLRCCTCSLRRRWRGMRSRWQCRWNRATN